jgi:hypothetical protein
VTQSIIVCSSFPEKKKMRNERERERRERENDREEQMERVCV